MSFVFLSHNSADKPAVEEIALRLIGHGIEPWLDAWRLVPGERWQPALERALAEAQASVVFFGPSGVGPWQEEEMRVAIDQRVRDADFRVIPVLLPGAVRGKRSLVPAFMANVTWVEFRSSLDEEGPFARLVAGIRGTPPRPARGPDAADVNPYCGLRYFDVEDSACYFGREALTGWLVSDIRNSLATRAGMRLLAIVGPSGSGKSSLARAGLLATLRNGAVEGSRDWCYAVLRPGAHPLEALAIAIAEPLKRDDGLAVTRFVSELADAPRLLHVEASLALRKAGDGGRLLLLIDQFEEIFTLCRSERERAGFVDNLLEAASAPGGPTIVVLTIRSDFLGHCAVYERLAAALSGHQELVGSMRRDELRKAIEQPAYMTGAEFEPGLVDALLSDVHARPGALPLLQDALFELWRERDGRRLTHAIYERIGRVQGALARRADDVFCMLEPGEQEVARRVLLRLTQPGDGTEDTRRRASIEEIAISDSDRERVDRVVRQLADERLLVTDHGTVDVAHEALIRNWPRLREWIEDRRSALRFHRRITEAAQEWQRLANDDSLLFRGILLEDARRWRVRIANELNASELAFLDASEALAKHMLEEGHRQRTVTDRMLWLQWGMGNAAGLALGMFLLSVLAGGLQWLAQSIRDFPPAGIPEAHKFLLMALVAAALGGSAGAILGLLQWIAAARAFPQLSPTRWIGASAFGAGLGSILVVTAMLALWSLDVDWLRWGSLAGQGMVVAGTVLVLLGLFVRHRSGIGVPWSKQRRIQHRLGVSLIAVCMLPLLVLQPVVGFESAAPERPVASPASVAAASEAVPMPAPGFVAVAHPVVVAAAATLLVALVGLLCWHHWSETAPRSLGRTDLFGLLLAAVIVTLPLSFLLRIDAFAMRDFEAYRSPSPFVSLAAMAVVGGAIGLFQALARPRLFVVEAWTWAAANALGMAVGTAAMGILLPRLRFSIEDFFASPVGAGDTLVIFFGGAGVLLGAFTGRYLLAHRKLSPSRP